MRADRLLDPADRRQLAGLPPDRFGHAARRVELRRQRAGAAAGAGGRHLVRPLQPPPHDAGDTGARNAAGGGTRGAGVRRLDRGLAHRRPHRHARHLRRGRVAGAPRLSARTHRRQAGPAECRRHHFAGRQLRPPGRPVGRRPADHVLQRGDLFPDQRAVLPRRAGELRLHPRQPAHRGSFASAGAARTQGRRRLRLAHAADPAAVDPARADRADGGALQHADAGSGARGVRRQCANAGLSGRRGGLRCSLRHAAAGVARQRARAAALHHGRGADRRPARWWGCRNRAGCRCRSR